MKIVMVDYLIDVVMSSDDMVLYTCSKIDIEVIVTIVAFRSTFCANYGSLNRYVI